jgi:hypothetical protein
MSAASYRLSIVPIRNLSTLSAAQVVDLQDALLANADRLLSSAMVVLDSGNIGLARSLAIPGMEESGKAIAIHERRVEMAYALEANLAYVGSIKRWLRRHDKLKQRGFYVDLDKAGGVLAPTGIADRESPLDVISHVHQISWQLRCWVNTSKPRSKLKKHAGSCPVPSRDRGDA